MCFGLRNAGQTFQRHINGIMNEVNQQQLRVSQHGLNKSKQDQDFAYAFVDDILIASNNEDEHKHHLETLFKALKSMAYE